MSPFQQLYQLCDLILVEAINSFAIRTRCHITFWIYIIKVDTYINYLLQLVIHIKGGFLWLLNIIPLGSHQFPASEPPGNFFLESHLRHKI